MEVVLSVLVLYHQTAEEHMDAAQTFKKTALFLATALLLAGAASAQTLTVSSGSANFDITGLPQTINVRSSVGAVTFSFTNQVGNWFTVSPSTGSTGANPATVPVTVSVTGDCSTSGGCSGTS